MENRTFYFAPLEGITDYIYRNTYHRLFEPMDAYFIPFLTPDKNGKLYYSIKEVAEEVDKLLK